MKKLTFEFDENAVKALDEIQRSGGYDGLGTVVGESLGVRAAMQELEKEGYSQVLVRNPRTNRMRQLHVRWRAGE